MERIRKYIPLWGTWNVKRQIGEGSFGAVYEVEKTVAGNTSFSAVKLISIKNSEMLQGLKMDETMSAEELAALILENAKKSVREAALMDKLQGRDNIVTIYDYDIYPNEKTTDVLIRMELLRNLKDYLTEVRADENLVINLGIDLCKALEICEEEKIVHRDIKPENIFVNKDRHFKLGDFGLSRQMTKSASLSLRKSKGTPLYMPPEALRWGDDDYVDHTSDIYSLALVMYQLLNRGKIPFCSDMSDYDEQYMAIGKRVNGKEQIPAPENCREELWDVIKKACSYEKKDRYQSAAMMREELLTLKRNTEVNTVYDKEPFVENYIWYACYGSNINEDRFLKYIARCRDTALPLEARPYEFNHPLFFGGISKTWNNKGKAFLDDTIPGHTYGKIYKITREQFKDVKRMEGEDYRKEIELAQIENLPVYTMTCKKKPKSTVPDLAYFSTIFTGLKETYQGYSEYQLGESLVDSIVSEDEIILLSVLRNAEHGVKNKEITAQTGMSQKKITPCLKHMIALKLIKQDIRSLEYSIDEPDAVFFTLRKERELIDEMRRLKKGIK